MSAEQERQALLGLALAALPPPDEHNAGEEAIRKAVFVDHEKEEPPSLADSIDLLTELTLATGENKRQSHRLLVLDLLAKVTARRGRQPLDDLKEQLTGFASAAVVEADRIERERDHPGGDDGGDEVIDPDPIRVEQTVNAFLGVPQMLPGTHEPHYWTAFTMLAGEALNLSPSELHRPLCTDDESVTMPNGLTAIRTAVWMWSDRPASTFAHWTDPRTWDTSCGLFFKAVTPVGPAPAANSREFEATFTETVNVDGTNDLTTELVFTRSVDDPGTGANVPVLYALGFDLPPPPLPPGAAIEIDCGQVTVRQDPFAPPGKRTTLLAEKYIRFTDEEYASWPTLACDTFWTEFAIVMAEGC